MNVGYVQMWQASLQYAVGPDLMIEGAYTGNKGTHLLNEYNFNEGIPDPKCRTEVCTPADVSFRFPDVTHGPSGHRTSA